MISESNKTDQLMKQINSLVDNKIKSEFKLNELDNDLKGQK